MSVPNQKRVIIRKAPCDKDHLYTTTNLDALKAAMVELKGETLKLWIYLSKNQNNFENQHY